MAGPPFSHIRDKDIVIVSTRGEVIPRSKLQTTDPTLVGRRCPDLAAGNARVAKLDQLVAAARGEQSRMIGSKDLQMKGENRGKKKREEMNSKRKKNMSDLYVRRMMDERRFTIRFINV